MLEGLRMLRKEWDRKGLRLGALEATQSFILRRKKQRFCQELGLAL